MKLYYAFLSLFISSSLTLSSCYPPAFQVLQVEWKTSFMHQGFGDDTLISEGRGCWGSIVWDHNIQGYDLIQNGEKKLFQQSCLRSHI